MRANTIGQCFCAEYNDLICHYVYAVTVSPQFFSESRHKVGFDFFEDVLKYCRTIRPIGVLPDDADACRRVAGLVAAASTAGDRSTGSGSAGRLPRTGMSTADPDFPSTGTLSSSGDSAGTDR